ncbi:unnamed protein product [Malus baccata var. baccata]
MKLEREPVFGHLSISHKPDSNPFNCNDITLDTAGLQSINWTMKESQNRVSCGSEVNEDAGQVPCMRNGFSVSNFDCSKILDDLENSNEDAAVKGFGSPYARSSENFEALEKESDYYMDKSVTECELPELIVCYKDSSCNKIKDICIDEGVPSQDKNWVETGMDEEACCTYLSPDEDQNKQMLEEQLDIVTTIPDGFKSITNNDLEKVFPIPCNSKDLMERGDAINSEKIAIDVSKEISSPAIVLAVQELGEGNPQSKSSNKDSNEAKQETVQVSSEIAKTESPTLVSETEGSNHVEEEVLVSAAEESQCLLGDRKAENRNIISGFDASAHVSITADARPQNGVCDMPLHDDGHDVKNDSISDSEVVPSQVQRCLAPMVVHLDARNTSNVADDISDSMLVSSHVQHCLPPVATGNEECPEIGVCQNLDILDTAKVDDDISDSKIVWSQVQHCSASPTIARDECPENGICQCPETSNTSKVDDISYSKVVSSQVQHWLAPETSYQYIGEDVNADTQNAPLQFQRGLGESSFSAAGHFSNFIASGPYSGNVSLRSESSTTSTRSFAFPVPSGTAVRLEWRKLTGGICVNIGVGGVLFFAGLGSDGMEKHTIIMEMAFFTFLCILILSTLLITPSCASLQTQLLPSNKQAAAKNELQVSLPTLPRKLRFTVKVAEQEGKDSSAYSNHKENALADLWKRAKTFAEEAAKKSQTLTASAKITDLVSETAKRSREFAAEASKKADEIKTAALKQADQIKSLSVSEIIPPQLASLSIVNSASASSAPEPPSPSELRKFGVTDDLRDFVKGLTSDTFKHFPVQDAAAEVSDVPTTTSNVRKDLTEWQERHATLVLTTVKEISRLRYELCPRVMKERIFWKIYFTLVSSHVAPYEKQYMEELKVKEAEKLKDDIVKPTPVVGVTDKAEGSEKHTKPLVSKSSSTEQDLDSFLLGDLEDSDGGPDDGDDGDGSFDDDFDKIGNSDVEDEKHVKK